MALEQVIIALLAACILVGWFRERVDKKRLALKQDIIDTMESRLEVAHQQLDTMESRLKVAHQQLEQRKQFDPDA